MSTQPYGDLAGAIVRCGIGGPIPLPRGQKAPPPKDTTGRAAPPLSNQQVSDWIASRPQSNIGIRLGSGIVGVDVDAYEPKIGGETYARLIAECGPLPATWISTSRRDTLCDGRPSGIRWYLLPKRTPEPGVQEFGPDVDLIRHSHRYAVVAPSVHPDTGYVYRWIGPDGKDKALPPHRKVLPTLPQRWVRLLQRSTDTPPAAEPGTTTTKVASTGPARPAAAVRPETPPLGYDPGGLARIIGERRAETWAAGRLTELANRVRTAREGRRNTTLNEAAFLVGQDCGVAGWSLSDIALTLSAAAEEAGLTLAEAAVTINSGTSAGELSPRTAEEIAVQLGPSTVGAETVLDEPPDDYQMGDEPSHGERPPQPPPHLLSEPEPNMKVGQCSRLEAQSAEPGRGTVRETVGRPNLPAPDTAVTPTVSSAAVAVALPEEAPEAPQAAADGDGDDSPPDRPPTPPEAEEGDGWHYEIIHENAASLGRVLRGLDYQWRADERHALRLELAPHDQDLRDPATPWTPLDDAFEAGIFQIVEQKYRFRRSRGDVPARFGVERRRDCLNAIAHKSRVDPAMVWLDWLAERYPDPSTEPLDRLLEMCFDVDPDVDPELLRWISAHIPMCVVQRTYDPGAEQHEHIILHGPQDCGKSTFLRWLLPPQNRIKWFSNTLTLDDSKKERIESMLGKVICESAELESPRRNLGDIKNFLTTNSDFVRLSYGHNPVDIPRRAVIVFTTNNDRCLPNDATGLRRFIPIHVDGTRQRVEEYLDADRDLIFAAAVHRYRAGGVTHIPDRLKVGAAAAAEQYRDTDDLASDILDQVVTDVGMHHQGALYVSLTDVAREAERKGVKRSTRYWAGVLTEVGWSNAGRMRIGDKRINGWTRGVPVAPETDTGDLF